MALLVRQVQRPQAERHALVVRAPLVLREPVVLLLRVQLAPRVLEVQLQVPLAPPRVQAALPQAQAVLPARPQAPRRVAAVLAGAEPAT